MTVAVEGKVAEAFGPTLGEWRQDFTAGKKRRLRYIQEALGIGGDLSDHVRYQLLHRMASAVHEAIRFGATAAALLIFSSACAADIRQASKSTIAKITFVLFFAILNSLI